MTRKSICLLFLVLLALPCFAASKYESKITSLEGEKWWGGAVGLGSKMPFEGDLRLFDLSAENLNNQNVPRKQCPGSTLLLLRKREFQKTGRYVTGCQE